MIAVDRGDADVGSRIRRARDRGANLRTPAIVIAQVWRDPAGRHARLAKLLRAAEVVPVDERVARSAGVLLARAGTSDPVDATVVLLAADGDIILTSDPADIARLVTAAGRRVRVVPC